MSPPPPSTTQGVESMPSHSTPPVAFSYIRFSTAEQRQGNSLDRQSEAARAWCARNGVRLDQSTSFRDLGRSAFLGEHRKNPDRGALAAFLRLVEQGKVPRGSFLVVENLDRLTREHVRAAVALFLQILEQGVSIVTTTPERVFRHDSQDMTDVIIAVVELSRGHGESKMKSERNGAAWQAKLEAARTLGGEEVLNARLPAWVERVGARRKVDKHGRERTVGGTLRLIPERAEVVKRIFALAGSGTGLAGIVKALTGEGVPAWGPSGVWIRTYVACILND